MSYTYQMMKIINKNSVAGTENITLIPSETKYTGTHVLSHLDSVDGFYVEVAGTRYGADVIMQLQQSCTGNLWEDVTLPIYLSSLGTVGVPVAFRYQIAMQKPVIGPFMPLLRFKFTSEALTGATISTLNISQRGLN